MSGKVTDEDDSPRVEPSPRLRSPFGGTVPTGGRPGSLFVPGTPAGEPLDVDAAAAADEQSPVDDDAPPLPPPLASAWATPAQLGRSRAAGPVGGDTRSSGPVPGDVPTNVNQAPLVSRRGPDDLAPPVSAPPTVADPPTVSEPSSATGAPPPPAAPPAPPQPAPAAEPDSFADLIGASPEATPAAADPGTDDGNPSFTGLIAAVPGDDVSGDGAPAGSLADLVSAAPPVTEPPVTEPPVIEPWTPGPVAEDPDAAPDVEGPPAEPDAATGDGATQTMPTATEAAGPASGGGATQVVPAAAGWALGPQGAPAGLLGTAARNPGSAAPAEEDVFPGDAPTRVSDPAPAARGVFPASPTVPQQVPQAVPHQVPPAVQGPPAPLPWGDGGDRFGADDGPATGGGGSGRGRRVLIGGGVLGLLLVAGYGAAAYATAGTVPRGTTVGGVDLGGLDATAAQDALTAAQQEVPTQLVVGAGDRQAELDREAAGLTMDPAAEVASLTGFSLDPRSLLRHVTGGEARAAGSGDEAQVSAALAELAPALEVAPKNAGVTFTGSEPAVAAAVPGEKVDLEAAAELLRRTWLTAGTTPVALPVLTTQPEVTQEEATAAVDTLAQPALAEALKVTVAGRSASVEPAALAPALRIEAGTGDALALAVDGAVLKAAVLKDEPGIETKAKDATFELAGGKPKVVPSVAGVTVDPAALATEAAKVLNAGEHTVTVQTAAAQPELTTEKAEALGVKERVSTFSTNLTSNAGRTENLRIAARTVNGTVVLPGETFSLNAVLGERTAAKGYNAAPAISGGRLVQDFGGGVSQMATTIFNNVFFSGLQDVYHKPHSFYISRYPEGREATVDWPTVDLKWKNDSPYAVLIQANVTSQVNVSFWSTKVWEIEATKSGRTNQRSPSTHYDDSPGCVAQDANGGFDVTIGRIFKKDGREVKRESFKAVYNAEDEIICQKKPDPKATASPAPD